MKSLIVIAGMLFATGLMIPAEPVGVHRASQPSQSNTGGLQLNIHTGEGSQAGYRTLTVSGMSQHHTLVTWRSWPGGAHAVTTLNRWVGTVSIVAAFTDGNIITCSAIVPQASSGKILPIECSPGNSDPHVTCEPQVYYGITHCTYATSSPDEIIEFLKIDGHDPHIEFYVAAGSYSLAQGIFTCQEPATGCRYTLEEMLHTWPKSIHGRVAVAAINTDYFGLADPPQGTTYRNGQRAYEYYSQTTNCDWNFTCGRSQSGTQGDGMCKRSSLAISRAHPYTFSIGWCKPAYTVTGAGPHFLKAGSVVWIDDPSYTWPTGKKGALNGEYFYNHNFSTKTQQSAAGISHDGQFLILASTATRMLPATMASRLRDVKLQGISAYEGIRLDGGHSAQLSYNNRFFLQQSRIAAGLIVYSEPITFNDPPGR